MPNTKSAKKRLRQSTQRHAQNRSIRSSVKSQVKKVRQSIAEGNAKGGMEELRLATKKLDNAAARGVIHKNSAARTKSRLSAALKAIGGKVTAAAK